MNFDFILDVSGLEYLFRYCENAEDLAISKPDLSIIAARKSAEELAKYAYAKAHSERMFNMTFDDILRDPAVKKYLKRESIFDAFHFVRKNGNDAVHTLNTKSPDIAISVLEKLHYVLGEVAKREGAISTYPKFNRNIKGKPNAVYIDISDSGEIAREMYDASVVRKNNVDELFRTLDMEEIEEHIQFVDGEITQGIEVEVRHRAHERTISQVQELFLNIIVESRKVERTIKEKELEQHVSIILFDDGGKTIYSADDWRGFKEGLRRLPEARSFRIASLYNGPRIYWAMPDPIADNETEYDNKAILAWKGLEVILWDISKREKAVCSFYEFAYNHGEGYCRKYIDGEAVDIQRLLSSSVLDDEYDRPWFCWRSSLGVEFDFEMHSDILERMQECTKRHIPQDDYENCEAFWDEPGNLLNDMCWGPNSLRSIQNYLDELNEIVEPIKEEFTGFADGRWYHEYAPIAFAEIHWTKEEGFLIKGVEL